MITGSAFSLTIPAPLFLPWLTLNVRMQTAPHPYLPEPNRLERRSTSEQAALRRVIQAVVHWEPDRVVVTNGALGASAGVSTNPQGNHA